VLEPSPFPPADSADIITNWGVLLVNNGQQTVSVLTLNISLLTPTGEMYYSGLVDAILDNQLRPTTPPWPLDPGKPINLVVRLRLHIDPSAYVYLHKAFPDGHIPSMQSAQMLLADQNLDFWGDSIVPSRYDSKVVGFQVKSMTRQPTINFRVGTARGTVVSDVAYWYPLPEP
jgi:hypothetical protein